MARKQQISKIQQHLKNKELALINPDAYKTRCKVELSTYRNVQSATDVVMLGQTAINSLIADNDGDVLDIKKATALGYLMAIQLTAIKMAKSEQTFGDNLSEKIHGDSAQLNMTTEEMKMLVFATNANIQLNVINRAADRPDSTQRKETVTIEQIGDMDLPDMLKTTIINAVKDVNGNSREEPSEVTPMPQKHDFNANINANINEDFEDLEAVFEGEAKK